MIGGKVEFRVEGLFIDLPTAAVKRTLNSLANKLEMLLVRFFEFNFWFRVKDAYPVQWNHAVKQLVPLPLVHPSGAGSMFWFLSKPALPQVSLLDKRCAISSAPVSLEQII